MREIVIIAGKEQWIDVTRNSRPFLEGKTGQKVVTLDKKTTLDKKNHFRHKKSSF